MTCPDSRKGVQPGRRRDLPGVKQIVPDPGISGASWMDVFCSLGCWTSQLAFVDFANPPRLLSILRVESNWLRFKTNGVPFWLVGEFTTHFFEPILVGLVDVHGGYDLALASDPWPYRTSANWALHLFLDLRGQDLVKLSAWMDLIPVAGRNPFRTAQETLPWKSTTVF